MSGSEREAGWKPGRGTWLVIGVIAVVLALVSISSYVKSHKRQDKGVTAQVSSSQSPDRPQTATLLRGDGVRKIPATITSVNPAWTVCGGSWCSVQPAALFPTVFRADKLGLGNSCATIHAESTVTSIHIAASAPGYTAEFTTSGDIKLCGNSSRNDKLVVWT